MVSWPYKHHNNDTFIKTIINISIVILMTEYEYILCQYKWCMNKNIDGKYCKKHIKYHKEVITL